MPPNVIDSPSFPVFLRLLILSIASEGLYLFLAAPSGATPLAFALLWGALFVAYALAIRAIQGLQGLQGKTGPVLVLFVFVTSALFRVSLLLGRSGFSTDVPEAFLHGASPVRAAIGIRPELEPIAAAAFDLGALALMPALLRAASLPAGLALVYGWNPLLVGEGGGRGRLAGPPLLFLLLAFLLLQKKRPGASALAYGASLAGPPFFFSTLPLPSPS